MEKVPTGTVQAWAIVLASTDEDVTVRVFTDMSWWAWLTNDTATTPPDIDAQIREAYGEDYDLQRYWIGEDLTHSKARALSNSDAGVLVMSGVYEYLSGSPAEPPETWEDSVKQEFALKVLDQYARVHHLAIHPDHVYVGTDY